MKKPTRAKIKVAKNGPKSGKKTRTPVEWLKEGKATPQRCINAKCFQCQGEDYDPGWKWRIGNCTEPECGLYSRRPYQKLEGRTPPKALAKLLNPEPLRKKKSKGIGSKAEPSVGMASGRVRRGLGEGNASPSKAKARVIRVRHE